MQPSLQASSGLTHFGFGPSFRDPYPDLRTKALLRKEEERQDATSYVKLLLLAEIFHPT